MKTLFSTMFAVVLRSALHTEIKMLGTKLFRVILCAINVLWIVTIDIFIYLFIYFFFFFLRFHHLSKFGNQSSRRLLIPVRIIVKVIIKFYWITYSEYNRQNDKMQFINIFLCYIFNFSINSTFKWGRKKLCRSISTTHKVEIKTQLYTYLM